MASGFDRLAFLRGLGPRSMERFAAAGPMPWKPKRVANQVGALVGDAAGYIEPFTGEGMAWALEGAVLLSEQLIAVGQRGWNERAAVCYARDHRAAIRRRQRWCHLLTATIRRPLPRAIVFLWARKHPAVARGLMSQVVSP